MMDATLINYGVLGAWTVWLLAQENYHRKTLKNLIENNTRALVLVNDNITECPFNKKRRGKYAK